VDLADLLANAAPDEVVPALIDAKWDTDKVQDLISQLTAKLKAQSQDALKAKVGTQSSAVAPRGRQGTQGGESRTG